MMSSVAENTDRNTSETGSGALLSVEEAARRLGLRPVTVRMWAAARRIAKVKLGRRVLIPAAEVQRLIEENLTPAL